MYTSYENAGHLKLLSLLKSHKNEYLSGQDLSDVLKISRVAIWKHIKKIRSLGYKIESKQKVGYCLVEDSKLMLPWEIADGLKTRFIGKKIYYYDTIDSTQNVALKIATNSKEDGTVVISQRQTKGRGRMGRKWISPHGGIWLSIILHPKFEISHTTIFPIASSIALATAIEKTIGIQPELKWPNDVTINGKKVAGMLVDTSIESNEIEYMVLGVGINFKVNPAKIEKSIKNSGHFYGVTTLTGKKEANPKLLIQSFLYELEKVIDLLDEGRTKKIINIWSKKSSNIGKVVTVKTSNGKIRGKFSKLDKDGALLITKNNKTHRILVGDVI